MTKSSGPKLLGSAIIRLEHWGVASLWQQGNLHQHSWPAGHGADSQQTWRDHSSNDDRMGRGRCLGFGYYSGPRKFIAVMEAFFISTGIVALAEIGDKTQLLAFLLAAKFRQPLPIVLAILVATIANHAFAAAIGTWITTMLGPETLRWVLGISFLLMAGWILIPDKLDEGDTKLAKYGVFTTTLIAFFLAEMGDKTQIATVALAAQYHSFVWVVAGTTLGMMLANAPAVYFGDKIANRMPVKIVHRIAAVIFALLGIATLMGAGARFGF